MAARFIAKIGYRISLVAAHIFASIGLIGLAVFPVVLDNAFRGLIISAILYAIGGGLIEVLISPIMEACPTERKSAAMSLLHSFYCWGQAGVIILSTLFFLLLGNENWRYLAFFWAVIPIFNSFYFTFVPIKTLDEEGTNIKVKNLSKNKIFWLMVLLMVCAGACEMSVSQWASAFVEEGLNMSKAIGDLAGPCSFALLMGCSRLYYAKKSEEVNLEKFMIISSILCLISYLLVSLSPWPILNLLGCSLCGLSVGIMWPGTYSISSQHIKGGGTTMFALLALAGDVGCSVGPTLVGFVAELFHGDMKQGILYTMIFPLLMISGLLLTILKPKVNT